MRPNPGQVTQRIFDTETFSIPDYLGQVKEIFKPENLSKDKTQRIIVHIQDAHCNYPAQKAISSIIKYVSETYGISDINLEGGAGGYNFGVFNAIEDASIRAKVADNLVKNGLVSGPEFFAITNPGKVDLWGIEDASLYLKDLGIYRDSLSYKTQAIEIIHEIGSAIDHIKAKIYSPALVDFDNHFAGYKSGKIEFNDYLIWLTDLASRTVMDYKQTNPNVYLIAQVLLAERGIDFKKANSERESFIGQLQELLSRKDMEELVSSTLEFKKGLISEKVFYEYLLVQAKVVDLKLDKFPDFQKYIIYISMYQACDKYKLMGEITAVEAAIKDTLFDNDDQRKISKVSKNLVLMENIFNIAISRDDYEYFIRNREDFGAERILPIIREELAGIGERFSPEMDIKELDSYLDDIQAFFEFSFKRDDAFMENLRFKKAATPKGEIEIAIIVTGGFHAANMAELFRKNDVSYVSIMPKFTNNAGYESPYFSLLEGNLNGVEKGVYDALSGTGSATIQVATFFATNAELENAWGEKKELAVKAAVLVMARIQAGKKVVLTANDGNTILGSWGDGIEEKLTVSELGAEVKAAEQSRAQEAQTRKIIDPANFGSGDVIYEVVKSEIKNGEEVTTNQEANDEVFAKMLGQQNLNIAIYTDQAGKLHVIFGVNTLHRILLGQVPGDSIKYAVTGVMAGVVAYYGGTSTILTPEQQATIDLFKIEIDRHTDENKAFKDFVKIDEAKLGLIFTDPFTREPFEYFAGKEGQHLLVLRALNNDYRDDINLLGMNKEPTGILKRINDKLIAGRSTPIYVSLPGKNDDGSPRVGVSPDYSSAFDNLKSRTADRGALFNNGDAGLYNIILGKANGKTVLNTQFANEDEYSLFGMAYPAAYARLTLFAAENKAELISKFYSEDKKLEKMPPIVSLPQGNIIVDLENADKCSAKYKADLGNKGANLGEMMRLTLPVPEGFVLTRQFYQMWKTYGRNADGTTTLTKALQNPAFKAEFIKVLKKIIPLLKDNGEVSIRSSGVVSMPGMLETEFAKREGSPSDGQMLQTIQDKLQFVLASWDAPKARYFREMMRIPDELGTAVIIQKLVRGDKQKGDQLSASGVVYSRDPNTGRAQLAGGYKELTPGKDIVSGQTSTNEIRQLAEAAPMAYTLLNLYASMLEKHFGFPQEIEFTIQDGKPYVLQTRDFKPSPRALEYYLKNEKKLSRDAAKKAKKLIKTYEITHLTETKTEDLVAIGKPSTAGATAGVIVFINEDGSHLNAVKKYNEAGKKVILITDVAPENLRMIEGAAGVLALKGDTTSHAAVLMRANNVPAIVGISDHMAKDGTSVSIAGDISGKKVLKIGALEFLEGSEMSMDGETGEVYRDIQRISKEDLDVTAMEQRIRAATTQPEIVDVNTVPDDIGDGIEDEVVEVMPRRDLRRSGKQVLKYSRETNDKFLKASKASLLYYAQASLNARYALNKNELVVATGEILHRELVKKLQSPPNTMGYFNFPGRIIDFRPYSKNDTIKPSPAQMAEHVDTAKVLIQHLWNDPEIRDVLKKREFRISIVGFRSVDGAEVLFNYKSLIKNGLISQDSDNTPYAGEGDIETSRRSSGAIADGSRADGKNWEELIRTAEDPVKDLGLSPAQATPRVLSQIEDALRNIITRVPFYYGPEQEANSKIIDSVRAEAAKLLTKIRDPEERAKIKIFLFNSQVSSKEDYLLGFRLSNGYLGLSVDVVNALHEGDITLLSEYLFHELAEQMDIEHDVLYGKAVKDAAGNVVVSAEKARERAVQGNMYGKANPLQPALRRFIDAQAVKQAAATAPDREMVQHVESAIKHNDVLRVFGKKDGSVIVIGAKSLVAESLEDDPNIIASGRILPASNRIEFDGRPGQYNLSRGIKLVVDFLNRKRLAVPGLLGNFNIFIKGVNNSSLSLYQPAAFGAIADGTNENGVAWEDLLEEVADKQIELDRNSQEKRTKKEFADPSSVLGVKRIEVVDNATFVRIKKALADISTRNANTIGMSDEDKKFLQAIRDEAQRIDNGLYGWGDLAVSRIFLFNSKIKSPDDYLLGFGIENGYVGISKDVMDRITVPEYPELFTEFLFHELAESLNKGMVDHHDLYGKFDRANSLQGRMFGPSNNPLKVSLRGFINNAAPKQGNITKADPVTQQLANTLTTMAPKGAFVKFVVGNDGRMVTAVGETTFGDLELRIGPRNVLAEGTINFSPTAHRINLIRIDSATARERQSRQRDLMRALPLTVDQLRRVDVASKTPIFRGKGFTLEFPYVTPEGRTSSWKLSFDAYSPIAFGAIASGSRVADGSSWEELIGEAASPEDLGVAKVEADTVLFDMIKYALSDIIRRKPDLTIQTQEYAQAIEKVKAEARKLNDSLKTPQDLNSSKSLIYLFESIVTGREDYLLGFRLKNGVTGLAGDLAKKLYEKNPVMLSEYVFHELAEALNLDDVFIVNAVYQEKHGMLYGKGNRARSPQGVMYDPAYNGITGADGTPLENPLKAVLREFIDLQAEAANIEFISVAPEENMTLRKITGGKPSIETASAGRFAERVKSGAKSGQEFYFTIIPVPGEPAEYRIMTDTSVSRLNGDSGGSENIIVYGHISTADKKITVIKNRESNDGRSAARAEKGYELLSGMGLPELKGYEVTVPGRTSFPFVLKYGESLAKLAAARDASADVTGEKVPVFDLTAEFDALTQKPEVASIAAGFPKDVKGDIEGDKPWAERIFEAKTPYDLGVSASSVDDATFNAFKASLGDIVARIDKYSAFQKWKFPSMNAEQRARAQAELAALDKVKERCRTLQPKLISPFSFMDKNLKVFAFESRIDGAEDYLLGFELGDGTTGISFDLIDYLLRAERKISKERGDKVSLVSEYIFHELAEKTLGKEHRELYGKYNRISSLQGLMYGERNYLGAAIREYIDRSFARRGIVELIKVDNAVVGGGSSIRGLSGSSGDLASALIAAKGNRADVELVIALSGGKPVVALNSAANRFSRTDVLGFAKISGTENRIRFTPVKTDPATGADAYRMNLNRNSQKLRQAVNIAVPQLRSIRNYDISKYTIEAQGLGIGGQLVGNYQGMRTGGMIASGARASDSRPWSEVIGDIVDPGTLELAGIPKQQPSSDTLSRIYAALDNIADGRPNLADEPGDKQAIDSIKASAAKLRDALKDTTSGKWEGNLYLFNSNVSGEEDYLLGFGVRNDATGLDVIGIASDLVDFLYDEKNISLLSEYIFHELAEHLDREHKDLYGKDDRAKSLQGIVFGPENTLKYALRNFIDMKAVGKQAQVEVVQNMPAGKDSTAERASVVVEESAAIRMKNVDVKVIVGNVYDPSTQSGMNNSLRNFNTNVKLKFGKDGDNQQLRTFKITLDIEGKMDADETIKSFSSEIEKGLSGLKESGRLVAYMPILDKSDIARMNAESERSAEDLLLDILTVKNDPNLSAIKQAIVDKKLILLKDAYTDCFRADATSLPDVAWRFVYARQYVNLLNTVNATGKKDTMLALLSLLKRVAGDDFNYPTETEMAGFMKEITDSGNVSKFFDFMSKTVIKIRPINYAEIQEYQQMMDKVAVSL